MDIEKRVLDISTTLDPGILFGVFGVALFGSLVMGLVYLYHWRKYTLRGRDVVWAELIYFLGTLVLLSLIFTTSFLYIYG